MDPFLDPGLHRNPPRFLYKNPLPVPLPGHFLHRNPTPSCTWCFGVLPRRNRNRCRPGPLNYRCHMGARQCVLGCIPTTHAMRLRPCLESLQISVVPQRVKLCEAPRLWHHLTRPAHDVTTILRECRAQNTIRVRYALGLPQKGLVIGYGLRYGFCLRTASNNPWRVRTPLHACVQSWEWAGHSTRVLQPPGRNSLSVCHQGLCLHVSCPHQLVEPEHRSTTAKAGRTLRILGLSSPPCLATPHHLLGLGPWPYVRLRMLNARSHSAALSSSRDPAFTLPPAPRAPRLRQLPTGLPRQPLVPGNLQWLPHA